MFGRRSDRVVKVRLTMPDGQTVYVSAVPNSDGEVNVDLTWDAKVTVRASGGWS